MVMMIIDNKGMHAGRVRFSDMLKQKWLHYLILKIVNSEMLLTLRDLVLGISLKPP